MYIYTHAISLPLVCDGMSLLFVITVSVRRYARTKYSSSRLLLLSPSPPPRPPAPPPVVFFFFFFFFFFFLDTYIHTQTCIA